jgi:hypothetical protein
MKTGRLQVLLALFVGAVFGSAAATVGIVWSGCARAGGATPAVGAVVTASCAGATKGSDGNLYAVASFPGSAKEDLAANVYLYLPDGDPNSPQGPTTIGATSYVSGSALILSPPQVADGSVAVACSAGATSVELYVRQ